MNLLLDFFWGDVSGLTSFLRTIAKIAFAVFIAILIHEYLLVPLLLTNTTNELNALESSFSQANEQLSGLKIDPNFSYTKLSLCLDGVPSVKMNCSKPQWSNQRSALGYQILGEKVGNEPVSLNSGSFFEVNRVIGPISASTIRSSTDTLLREIERFAFNGPDKPVTDLSLCTGTRKLQTGPNCAVTSKIQALLDPSTGTGLGDMTNRIRFGSLFVGPIQFGTLCVFIFSVIEVFGLRWRWVNPADALFDIKKTDDGVAFIPSQLPEALHNAEQSPVQSIGDRLYLVDLKAAGDGGPESPAATNEEIISTHGSYRTYLLDDAVTRQESLETLGDTMLKLAFLGTVYGISKALFSARGLDTADPIARLATKADMYSGIGIGFGATMVGIILSIIAAEMRSDLAATWSGRIGSAYQRILDFGAVRLRDQARNLTPAQVRTITINGADEETGQTTMELFGLIVIIIAIGVVLYSFRAELLGLFARII